MGLLDEAIRQHLELKRQHGASDEELQLQEQEALGPVRREPVEPAAETPEDPEAVADPALEQEVEDPYGEPPIEAEVDVPVYEETPEEASLEPLDEEVDEPIDPYGAPVTAEPDPETEALLPEEDFDSEASGDTPSRGFDAVRAPLPEDAAPDDPLPEDAAPEDPLPEDALPEEGDDGELADDDVLEETPEFLQETPEHDRLWFEQKPPRDFDFDE